MRGLEIVRRLLGPLPLLLPSVTSATAIIGEVVEGALIDLATGECFYVNSIAKPDAKCKCLKVPYSLAPIDEWHVVGDEEDALIALAKRFKGSRIAITSFDASNFMIKELSNLKPIFADEAVIPLLTALNDDEALTIVEAGIKSSVVARQITEKNLTNLAYECSISIEKGVIEVSCLNKYLMGFAATSVGDNSLEALHGVLKAALRNTVSRMTVNSLIEAIHTTCKKMGLRLLDIELGILGVPMTKTLSRKFLSYFVAKKRPLSMRMKVVAKTQKGLVVLGGTISILSRGDIYLVTPIVPEGEIV